MNKTGFGFLRLPCLDPSDEKSVDDGLLCAMVDRFLSMGGSYFDTAYTYLGGASEEAFRRTVVQRYPRDAYRIADKLPGYAVTCSEDNRSLFEESLRRCGLDWFDVYLLHGLNEENYQIAKKFDQFAFLQQLREEGNAKKIGFSYHDTPELLDRILTEHPEVDYVQLQINYLDWDSFSIQAKQCYETAVRHGKQVLVMEPVKGGSLADLPLDAKELLKSIRPDSSFAHWAMRFASALDNVEIVLSGMNSIAQMEDNMQDMIPLTAEESAALEKAAQLIRANTAISCTGCSYCTAGCPQRIPIPKYFALYNEYKRNPGELWKSQIIYDSISKAEGKGSDCSQCGQCIKKCPQKLKITDLLPVIDEAFSSC